MLVGGLTFEVTSKLNIFSCKLDPTWSLALHFQF